MAAKAHAAGRVSQQSRRLRAREPGRGASKQAPRARRRHQAAPHRAAGWPGSSKASKGEAQAKDTEPAAALDGGLGSLVAAAASPVGSKQEGGGATLRLDGRAQRALRNMQEKVSEWSKSLAAVDVSDLPKAPDSQTRRVQARLPEARESDEDHREGHPGPSQAHGKKQQQGLLRGGDCLLEKDGAGLQSLVHPASPPATRVPRSRGLHGGV